MSLHSMPSAGKPLGNTVSDCEANDPSRPRALPDPIFTLADLLVRYRSGDAQERRDAGHLARLLERLLGRGTDALTNFLAIAGQTHPTRSASAGVVDAFSRFSRRWNRVSHSAALMLWRYSISSFALISYAQVALISYAQVKRFSR